MVLEICPSKIHNYSLHGILTNYSSLGTLKNTIKEMLFFFLNSNLVGISEKIFFKTPCLMDNNFFLKNPLLTVCWSSKMFFWKSMILARIFLDKMIFKDLCLMVLDHWIYSLNNAVLMICWSLKIIFKNPDKTALMDCWIFQKFLQNPHF